jgi:hypothetical protein
MKPLTVMMTFFAATVPPGVVSRWPPAPGCQLMTGEFSKTSTSAGRLSKMPRAS